MATYLEKVHIFDSLALYNANKDKVGSNDMAFVKDETNVENNTTYVSVMENGIDPDVLVTNGTLLAGTGLKSEDTYPYKSTTAVDALKANSVVTLNKSWTSYKYLVFLAGHNNSSYYEPCLLVLPVSKVQNRKKLFETYITSSSGTSSLVGASINLVDGAGNNGALWVQMFNGKTDTHISNVGTEIYFNSSSYNLYAIYGIDSLGE